MAGKRDQSDPALAARLKSRREELGLSKREVGRRIGLSVQQISKYEQADNALSSVRLRELAGLLDFDPTPFVQPGRTAALDAYPTSEAGPTPRLREEEEPSAPVLLDPEAQALLDAYRTISRPAVRRAVLNFVAALAAERQDRPQKRR